jgi:hypothetical protein
MSPRPLCSKHISVLTSIYLNLYRTPELAVELPAARALASMLVLMSVPEGDVNRLYKHYLRL